MENVKTKKDLHDHKTSNKEFSTPVDSATAGLMELRDNLSHLTDYHAVQDSDMNLLISLINRAKGPSRSMRQFCKACGISPATMSRIMNGKVTGHVNDEIIARIAAYADPESGVTFGMLLEANGKEKKNLSEGGSKKEENARRTILDELLIRGYSVSEVSHKEREGPGFAMIFDFEVKTDALCTGKSKNEKWLFEITSGCTGVIDFNRPPVGFGRFRQWLAMVMALYYCGCADAKRISYVVDREEVFERNKEILKAICIPDEISLILIRGGRVLKEYIAPKTNEEPKEVFYEIQGNERDFEVENNEEQIWDMSVFEEDKK